MATIIDAALITVASVFIGGVFGAAIIALVQEFRKVK